MHGAQLHRVSVCHLTEGNCVFRHINAWALCAGYFAIDAVHQPRALDTINKLLRAALVGSGDSLRHGDVAGRSDGLAHGQHGVHLVGVYVLGTEVNPRFSADGNRVVNVHLAVVKRHHHCDGFEGGAGLYAVDGMVLHLVVVAVLGAVEVGYGFDFSAVDLHEYAATPLGVELLQGLSQGFLYDVLQVCVDGGAYVVAVLRLSDGYILGSAADTLACTQSLFAFQLLFESHLQPRVAVTAVAVDTAYCAACERAEGLDTLVLRLENDTALVLPQTDEFYLLLQLSFLQVVNALVA